MVNFAISGVAGYIAPRHLKAINETNNELIAALDPHDSVGIIDRFAPRARFFKAPERFDRHLEKLRRKGEKYRMHWFSICSPNYLHDAHVRMAFRLNANAICEKPLVLNPWNLDALQELEEETGRRVWNVLQLRLHPSIKALKARIDNERPRDKYDIELTYITPRGPWYLISWKGNANHSGGLATNIGVHFYDMLIWVFGPVEHSEVHMSQPTRTCGYLELEKARVRWFLSIDMQDAAAFSGSAQPSSHRVFKINDQQINFSDGFSDLHTELYRRTLAGKGFGIDDVRPSIQLIRNLRIAEPIGISANSHPFVRGR